MSNHRISTPNSISIPKEMRHLPRDPRGYPIFYIALKDAAGKAHFIINDHQKVVEVAREDRCGLCGKRLPQERWFIGGILSAFHQRGAFIDPPMHDACAHYSLQVCPWLANARYSGVVLDKFIDRASQNMPENVIGFADHTQTKGKPQVFVCLMVIGQEINFGATAVTYLPNQPFLKVEYWRDGAKLPATEGKIIRDQVINGELPPTRSL